MIKYIHLQKSLVKMFANLSIILIFL